MNIKQTTKLTWHISDNEYIPLGIVDKDGDNYVAMRNDKIIDICPSLKEAAWTLKK